MARIPRLFVSHGAPTLLLYDTPTRAFLEGLEEALGRPRGVVCVSAHWESPVPTVSAATAPETIHDFFGFPPALYEMRYPAPGDPDLARRVLELLRSAGLAAASDPSRGLDHGAWVPLALMYPRADVPVVELSVPTPLGPRQLLAMGRALAPLADESVLVLASGGATHNLREFGRYEIDASPAPYAREFDDWLHEAVSRGDVEALAMYADRGPHASRNHPSPEHFLPILVPAGAAGAGVPGRRIHAAFEYGILSMAAFGWD